MTKSLGDYNIEKSSSSDLNNINWSQKKQKDDNKPKKKKSVKTGQIPSGTNIIYKKDNEEKIVTKKIFKIEMEKKEEKKEVTILFAGDSGDGMQLTGSQFTNTNAFFGNDGMYMEKFIEEPRHIEIQIAADQFGTVCHLSERDCSIQRRHQKLVEETPSPFITDKLRKSMGDAAKKAAAAVNYEGVGTVEFLVDKHRKFYFMEMNTRIQVEHTITEEVINRDLVKEQIRIASGEKISGKDYFPQAHSIQCRINAEDPHNNFMPSPGKITSYHSPGGHGIRIDTHAYGGYKVPSNYDSMVGKLITYGESRDQALARMDIALSEIVVEGIKTNVPLHRDLVNDRSFMDGGVNIHYLENKLKNKS